MCFTHTLQVRVPNVSSTFRRMLHSNVFHFASVLCCTRRVGGPADGGAVVGVRWGVLVLNCLSLTPKCYPRGERRRLGAAGGRRDEAKCACGAEQRANGVGAKSDQGGLRGRPDARVRPDIRALGHVH
jgi:hypothetical protein